MADYFCQFSCMFDVGTAENAARAIEIQRQQAVAIFDEEAGALGFDVQHDPDTGPGALWISSDEYGEPEHVIAFVLACAAAFDLQGRWGFVGALTCARPRLDGFGGGGQVIDLGAGKSLAWIDCEHWLQERSIRRPMPKPALRNRRRSAADRSWAAARNRPMIGRSRPISRDRGRALPLLQLRLAGAGEPLFVPEAAMPSTASELSRRLAANAESVCRHYLSNGYRQGRYWLVGDTDNTPGRSLYVRLHGPEAGQGAAGKWTDYVARWIMLRPVAGRRFCWRSAGAAQHNLSVRGGA